MEINKSSYQIGKTKVSGLTKVIVILTQNKSYKRVMCFLSYLGVPQGEGEAAASWHSYQRSHASHHHPAAVVPFLLDTVALSAKTRRNYDYTGTVSLKISPKDFWRYEESGIGGKDLKPHFREAGENFTRRRTELLPWSSLHGEVHSRGQLLRRKMERRCHKLDAGGTSKFATFLMPLRYRFNVENLLR